MKCFCVGLAQCLSKLSGDDAWSSATNARSHKTFHLHSRSQSMGDQRGKVHPQHTRNVRYPLAVGAAFIIGGTPCASLSSRPTASPWTVHLSDSHSLGAWGACVHVWAVAASPNAVLLQGRCMRYKPFDGETSKGSCSVCFARCWAPWRLCMPTSFTQVRCLHIISRLTPSEASSSPTGRGTDRLPKLPGRCCITCRSVSISVGLLLSSCHTTDWKPSFMTASAFTSCSVTPMYVIQERQTLPARRSCGTQRS